MIPSINLLLLINKRLPNLLLIIKSMYLPKQVIFRLMLIIREATRCRPVWKLSQSLDLLSLIITRCFRELHIFVVMVLHPVQWFVVFSDGRLPPIILLVLDGEKIALFLFHSVPDTWDPVVHLGLGSIPWNAELFFSTERGHDIGLTRQNIHE